MVVELPKCKGTRLEPMSGTACDMQPKSIDNSEQGCGRKSLESEERGRKAMGRTLEPMSGTACVVQPQDRRSMMWMEGVGGWEGGQHANGPKRETNVRNRLCCATKEHGLRQLAAARGEKSERQNAEGRMLELQMGDRVDSATIQHWIASWTEERILR
jgi:hypothetical protein